MTPATISTFIVENAAFMAAWALLLGLIVAGLAAIMHCQVGWIHRWLSMGWLSDLVLSADPNQKVLGIRFLVGSANCAAGVAALNFGVARGAIDPAASGQLTMAALAVQLLWYLAVRSGWNKRFSDPSLAEPMRSSVIVFLAWGYLIGGPGRPVALMLLFMMLLFGMFTGTSRQLIRSSVLAALVFGAMMLYIARTERHVYMVAEMQIVYFGVMMTMLISVCLLVIQLTTLRARSTQRKNDLSKALDQLQLLATRDELTGLLNRRHMVDLLRAEKQRADRSRRGFAMCMIDVDHFKSVNDRFGHGVGDDALRTLTSALRTVLRDTDVVARWGGEEFLIMFTDTDDDATQAVLERVRHQLKASAVSPLHTDLRITFSAGLTAYRFGEEVRETIERADQALYRAKAAGRNRTERAVLALTPTAT
jgi:diguanylate cyclase (GGDEF)-like protein